MPELTKPGYVNLTVLWKLLLPLYQANKTFCHNFLKVLDTKSCGYFRTDENRNIKKNKKPHKETKSGNITKYILQISIYIIYYILYIHIYIYIHAYVNLSIYLSIYLSIHADICICYVYFNIIFYYPSLLPETLEIW